MQRFTISLDDDLAVRFDALISTRGYDNRSQAVRDLIRTRIDEARLQASSAQRRQDIGRAGSVAVA